MKLSSQFSFIRKASQPRVDAEGAKPRPGDSEFCLTREGTLGLKAKSRQAPNVFQRLFKGASGAALSRVPTQTSQASQSTRSSFIMPRRFEPSRSTSASSKMQDSGDGGNHVSAEQEMAHSQTHSESRYSTRIIHSLNALSQSRQSSAADSDRTMIRHSSLSQDSRRSSFESPFSRKARHHSFSVDFSQSWLNDGEESDLRVVHHLQDSGALPSSTRSDYDGDDEFSRMSAMSGSR